MRFGIDQQAALIDRVTKYFINNPDNALWVEDYKPPRTDGQQALIHCIIRDIANHSGCGEGWLKTMLKRDSENLFPHWPKKVEKNRHGDKVLIAKSESQLTKAEESELIERLYVLGAEFGMNWSQ